MGYLNRDAILGADDAEFRDVEVPEWGGQVRIRSITGAQRDAFEASLREGKGKNADVNLRNMRAKLIILCAVDEAGRKLFTTEDLRKLGSKNARPLDRLFDACTEMIGMSEKDVETYVEDFGQSPDEDSNTD
jgi:hypothetical protein